MITTSPAITYKAEPVVGPSKDNITKAIITKNILDGAVSVSTGTVDDIVTPLLEEYPLNEVPNDNNYNTMCLLCTYYWS